MFNIAQVGVDKKSGAPIIQRSSTFTYNNDPNGTSDIFYYFGSRLRSSSFVNPSSTQFLNASRLNAGTITGPGANAVDNSILTNLFAGSTDATDGVQVEFSASPFNLTSLQLNSNTVNWLLEGSNDGTTWTNIALGSFQNIGNNWSLISISNAVFYSHYRLIHGESGVSKDLVAIKFFGTYQNGDIAPAIDNEAQFLATHRVGPGVIYLPDAAAEVFPENYYCTFLHFKTGEYTYSQFAGGSTPVNDNTNGVLRQGEQLLAVFDNGSWELFKVGSGTDVGFKGALLTNNGSQSSILPVGLNSQYLKADSTATNGLVWDSLDLTDLSVPTNDFNMGGQKIVNAGVPTSPSDYVTKSYADSIAAGFDPKQSCEVATTSDLVTETGLNWTPSGSGVGKTLTSNGSSASIDSVLLQNDYRVLVKNESPSTHNGIYVVSGVGGTLTLTRSTDFDQDNEVTPGAFTFITQGNVNISTGHILLGNTSLNVDSDLLNFSQFVGGGALSFSSLGDTNVGTPSGVDNNKFVGWNNGTGFYELLQKPGTSIGDLLLLEDVSGSSALPAVDGTQLSLNSSQVSPLNTKGDLWTYNTEDASLPVGSDNQLLVSASGESTGLKWKTLSSNGLTLDSNATDLTIEFNTGAGTIILGSLTIDDALSPNDNEFLRYDAATSKFVSEDVTGTSINDLVVLEDIAGNPGLPAVDGSQLTNVNVAQGQGSPLNTKGDIYIYDDGNTRLPVGSDFTVLTADSTATEGLSYKTVAEASRVYKDAVNDGGIARDYVSDGDTNGILYFVGTEEGTEPFVNPHDAGLIIVTTGVDGSPSSSNLNSTNIVDRTNQTASFSANGSNLIIDTLKNDYVLLEKLSFRIGFSAGTPGLTGNFIVRVASTYEEARTGSGGETLINVDPSTLGWNTNTYFNYDFTPVSSYRYIYIRWSTQIVIDELEIYGEVNPAGLSYNLLAEDEKGIVTIPPVSNAAVILPVGLPQGFSVFIQNRGNTFTTLSSDGNSSIIGDSNLYNEGDLLVVTNIGSDTWISSNLSSIQLDTKGQLLGFNNKPIALQPGTSGQVLTANSNSDLGFRWENRAGADDLIYSKEIPTQILGNYAVNDIFEYIGRDNDITFSNTFTNPADGIRLTTNTNSSFGTGFNNVDNLTNQTNVAGSLRLGFNQFASWQFNTVTIQPYYIAVLTRSSNNDADWDIEVSNNGSSWISVGKLPLNKSNPFDWVVATLDIEEYYSYLRLRNTEGSGLDEPHIDEIKLFGWVKDNPQQGEIFAAGPQGIEAVPPGTNGQTLVVNNLTSSHLEWVTPQSSPTTTKGDLSVHDGTGEVRQPVGADTTVLIADSSESTGVRWDSVDSVAGNPFTSQRLDISSATQLTTSNARYLYVSAVGGTQDIVLTNPPSINDFFYIVNRDGNNPIQIKEIPAGSVIQTINSNTPVAQCHFDGVEWQVVSMGTI